MKTISVIAAGLLIASTAQAEIKTEPKAVKRPAEATQQQIKMMTEQQARKVCSNRAEAFQNVAEYRAKGNPIHKLLARFEEGELSKMDKKIISVVYDLDARLIYSKAGRAEAATYLYKDCMRNNSIKSVEEPGDKERF